MSRGMDVNSAWTAELERRIAYGGGGHGDRRTAQRPCGHQVLRGAVDLSEHGRGAILVCLQEGDA